MIAAINVVYLNTAQNYQYRQLLKQKIGEQQKEKELMRELLNQIEALQKMKNAIEIRSTKLAQKENRHKKIARDNRMLFQVINQFAEKLSNADLLTGKDKRLLQNLAKNSSIWEEELNSKDQEETDNSSPSKSCKEGNSNISQNMNTSHEHSYCLTVPRRSLIFENLESNEEGLQFNDNKTSSFQKEHVANYLMKGCHGPTDYFNMSKYAHAIVNHLEEMRHQFPAMNQNFSPIIPLPPTPLPKSIVSKYNQPSKNLNATKPYTMTVSSKQNSVISDNQISQVTKTPSSTPKKNQFCHQQSEGFKIPIKQTHNTSNLNSKDSEKGFLNVTSSDSPNCINLNVERVGNNGLNLKFDIPCTAHLKIDLDNWRVSCYLESYQNSSPKNSSSLPSETCLTNKQKDNVSRQPVDEGRCKKKPKVLY